MKLTNLNIQSVAIKSTKNINLVKEDNRIKTVKRDIINKDLITTNAIEFKHTQFKCEVNNILLDVICPGYKPDIIFSTPINDYWKPMKVTTTLNRDTVDDLDIYWDYLYEDMEIKGIVKDNTFIIDIPSLRKNVAKCLNDYNRNQLKEAKLNKKYK